jgi:hypothetical protein
VWPRITIDIFFGTEKLERIFGDKRERNVEDPGSSRKRG